ncbi:MAG: hypothetical protein AB4352_13160 [Hormoscilla sp.]
MENIGKHVSDRRLTIVSDLGLRLEIQLSHKLMPSEMRSPQILNFKWGQL